MVVIDVQVDLIEEGRQLLLRLDQSFSGIQAAMWLRYPGSNSWNYLVSAKSLDKQGPKSAYALVQKVLHKIDEGKIKLGDIQIEKTDSGLLKLMRRAVRVNTESSGLMFTGNSMNGVLLPDAYIYRLL